eukprot:6179862-Pleurochrysis_carterae.AAC.2
MHVPADAVHVGTHCVASEMEAARHWQKGSIATLPSDKCIYLVKLLPLVAPQRLFFSNCISPSAFKMRQEPYLCALPSCLLASYMRVDISCQSVSADCGIDVNACRTLAHG